MWKQTSLLIAVLSLVICLVSAVLVFLGKTTMEGYKQDFLFWSLIYAVFATVWSTRRKTTQNTSATTEEKR